ncbi:MAG: hypothetical protein ACPL0C_04830 [Candidatus Bathyarchaeales archaeon]
MKKIKLVTLIYCLSIAILPIAGTKAQNETITKLLNIPGINIQVNATATTLPGQNVSMTLSLSKSSGPKDVYIGYINVSVFGFVYGKDKILIASLADGNISLVDEYNCVLPPFAIPENVWGITQGEITLSYNATYEQSGTPTIITIMPYENLKVSFDMTYVENTYLKSIEEKLANLNATFFDSFNMSLSEENIEQLNQTYWDYVQKYDALKGSAGELENLRNVSVILGVIAAVLFVSTVYLLFRKPKEQW